MNVFPAASQLIFGAFSNELKLLSMNPGWYFTYFLVSITFQRICEIQNLANISFTSTNMVHPGCYIFYLDESQLFQLSNLYDEILIVPYSKYTNDDFSRKNIAENSALKCKIKSIPNWFPLNDEIKYVKISNDMYVALEPCSTFLNDPRILHLSPYKGRKFLNRYNRGFIQTGTEDWIFENGSLVSPHPIYDIGIRGENQVISIFDTGVDVTHPFFFDPKKPLVANKTNIDHRKIFAYYSFAGNDTTDGKNGHGTHVAGIAAGESYKENSGISLYNGMAPKAKLHVVDLGFTGRDLNGEVNTDVLYKMMVDENVYISSNSWGLELNDDTRADTNFYDFTAYNFPNLIFTFAAGNEGNYKIHYYTINSPGDSKNVLSIGGLSKTQLSSIENGIKYSLETSGQSFDLDYDIFSNHPKNLMRGEEIQTFSNLSITYFSDKKSKYENQIVVFDDSKSTSFCKKIEKALNSAAAIIHFNKNNACKKFEIPSFVINPSSKLGPNGTILETVTQTKIKRASFSSVGPSYLGFCKPDVLFPGETYSSSAGMTTLNTDSLSYKSGTSMATPAAAGTVALLRQFYTDGFYPLKKATASKGFNPTSSLLRATLINSAIPFDSTSSGPNVHTGFGVPNISSVFLEPLRIIRDEGIKSNEKHTYFLNINNNNASLRITMAYLDPPLSVISINPLFADLDLIVISPSGKIFIGNEKPDNQLEMTNTIERVIIKKEFVEIGKYTILVQSHPFYDSIIEEIRYSMVINGPFDHFDFINNQEELFFLSNSEKCEYQCKNNGVCSNGKCQCLDEYIGYDCSTKLVDFSVNKAYSISVSPSKISFIHINAGEYNEDTAINTSFKLVSDDSHAAIHIFLSEYKFETTSDPNVLSINVTAKTPINQTIFFDNSTNRSSFNIYAAIKAIAPNSLTLHFSFTPISFNYTESILDSSIISDSYFSTPTPSYSPSPTTLFPPATTASIINSSVNPSSFINKIVLFIILFTALLILSVIALFIVLYCGRKKSITNDPFYQRKEEPKLDINDDDIETIN